MNTKTPEKDCNLCPRLVEFRNENIRKYPEFANMPVPSFGSYDSELLIIGLAPGLKGANKTGRPFTGDYAGDLLYQTLIKYGFAEGIYKASPDDGVVLKNCRLTNAVRCVPPQNKVTGSEINTCNEFLKDEIAAMDNIKAILVLGTVAHNAVLKTFGMKLSSLKFGHNAVHKMKELTSEGHSLKEKADRIKLLNSYHCSRYNTSTGRLTERMFHDVFDSLINIMQEKF